MTYLILLLAVTMTTLGQLLQKLGSAKLKHGLAPIPFILHVFSNKEFLLAVACLATGTVLWLIVLVHMEVSKAYPFLSLGYVLIVAISKFYLKEDVNFFRWVGVLLITIGTVMVGVS